MSNLKQIQIITDRFDCLSIETKRFRERIKNKSDSRFSLRNEIQEEIKKFQSFFTTYRNYFLQKEVIEQYSDQATQSFVLSKVMEKTVENWSILSKAIDQRYNTSLNPHLEQLDQKAYEFYKRFEVAGDNKPITYFGKVFNLTRFPYNAAPLLGVPFDRIGQPDLHEAIAHELGHFVFWNNGDLEEYRQRLITLRQEIAMKLGWNGPIDLIDLDTPHGDDQGTARVSTWLNWAEEIFADVFGTLMSGPTYAKNAQDLQVCEQIGELADLVGDDGRHPMPFLRPLISLATLRIMAEKLIDQQALIDDLNKLIQKLDERWRCYKEAYPSAVATRSERHHQYHNHEDAEHPHEHEVFRVAPEVLLDDVEKVVEAVVKVKLFIKDAQPKSLLECVQYWGREDEVSASKDIKDVLSELEDDDLLKLPPARAVSKPKIPVVNLSAAPNVSFQELLGYIRAQRENRVDSLESEEWEDILNLVLSSEVGLEHSHNRRGDYRQYLAYGDGCGVFWHIHSADGGAVPFCKNCNSYV